MIRDFLSEIGVCNQIHGEPESLGLLDLRLACAKKEANASVHVAELSKNAHLDASPWSLNWYTVKEVRSQKWN